MARTNHKQINPGEIFGKLMEQAKELTSKPVENISDSLTNRSLTHIDEHYALAKNEEIEGLIQLLKEQEQYLGQLTEAVKNNDSDIKGITERIARHEDILANQLEVLKEDNKACANELKGIIENNGQVDYTVFEEAFKKGSDTLVSQQRAHTVEMDRMMMSLKTSIEKNIEKMKGVIEKKVETTANAGNGVLKTTMILTIVNLLCLIGYIVYDVMF